ncbi:MAG: T9SS type A sorting domain-containing protein [Candidatus Kapaibacterium sp.]
MKKLIEILVLILIMNLALLIRNCEAQWIQMTGGIGNYQNVYSLANIGNNIFAGTSLGIWRSTNNGTNWTLIGLNTKEVRSLAVSGTNIFASIVDLNNPVGVYISTNNGTNWTQTALNNLDVDALTASGTNIYAGTEQGVYHTSNNGASWTFLGLTDQYVHAILVVGSSIYAGCDMWGGSYGGGVYASGNNGASWSFIGLYNSDVNALAAVGNTVFAGIDYIYPNQGTGGVYVYNNSGTSWSTLGLGNEWVYALAVSGNNLFSGSSADDFPTFGTGGVYLSTNSGSTFINKNQGYYNEDMRIASLLIANNYIFSGCSWRGVWRRSLSEIINVQNISTEIPSKYTLSQNYPNPFNPTTSIEFDVVQTAEVVISVFDVSGKEIEILVNEKLQPGKYKTEWNGTGHSSGVYFYRMQTGNFNQSKQMLMIK